MKPSPALPLFLCSHRGWRCCCTSQEAELASSSLPWRSLITQLIIGLISPLFTPFFVPACEGHPPWPTALQVMTSQASPCSRNCWAEVRLQNPQLWEAVLTLRAAVPWIECPVTFCVWWFGSLWMAACRVPGQGCRAASALREGTLPAAEWPAELHLVNHTHRAGPPSRQCQAAHRHHLWLNRECFDRPTLNSSLFYFAFSIFSNASRLLWTKISFCKRNIRIKPEKPARFDQWRNYSFSDRVIKATHTEGAR